MAVGDINFLCRDIALKAYDIALLRNGMTGVHSISDEVLETVQEAWVNSL